MSEIMNKEKSQRYMQTKETKRQDKERARQDFDRAQAAINNKMYDKQEAAKLAQYRRGRNEDLKEGANRGEQIFGKNALGRVDASRSQAVQDILSQRQAQLQGFTPEEQQAMRENNMKSISQSQQAGSRDLARQQARSGVRGALGSAQQQAFQTATQGQVADQERNLFLGNIDAKRNALGAYEQSVGGAEQSDMAKQQFNLGQQNKELMGKLATELGYGSLGASERSAAMQSVLGDKGLQGSKDIVAATGGKF